MSGEDKNKKPYDLEERTFLFAKRCRDYIKKLPKTITNIEYAKQLTRSSGSVGANYIEANESLGEKDFLMRIRISRKESKESRMWLALTEPVPMEKKEQEELIQESKELMNIFGSMVRKKEKKNKEKNEFLKTKKQTSKFE
jgi:four helix bundle protein